jgi:hypothetical protein
MNRRGFLKALAGSAALVAAVQVGLGNVITEDVVPEVITYHGEVINHKILKKSSCTIQDSVI